MAKKKKLDKLRIIQWNIQGLRAKNEELRSILWENKILIACLQETLLGDSHWQPPRHYKLERSPHFGGDNNRGVAIMLHSSLQHSRLHLNSTLEVVAATIRAQKAYTVCSIYLSPNTRINKGEIRDIIRQLPRPFILLGDFNGKHPLWDLQNPSDHRGRDIEALIMEESLAILNHDGKATHYHIQTNKESVIDLSLCSLDIATDFHQDVDKDLHGSDHYPVYLTAKEFLPQQNNPRWLQNQANWTLFTELADQVELIISDNPLHNMNSILKIVKEAATASIPRSDGYLQVGPVPWWNDACNNIRKARNKAQKQMSKYPTIPNRVEYKKLRGKSQRIQKNARATSWIAYVSTVNSYTEHGKVWRKVDKIKGKHCPKPPPAIKVNGILLTDPDEVANSFAGHFANVSIKTKELYPREYARSQERRKRLHFNRTGGHPDNYYLNAPFTIEDLEAQLLHCKDSAPGPDDITVPMLKHLSANAKNKLLEAFNQMWEAGKLPSEWKKEIKLPLLKPGKDPNLPQSYRPISLSSCVCKLFERMVNQRLMWFLEKHTILCPQQSGFRKNKSTMDALIQLTSCIERGFQDKRHTTAVFFDLEKAYDTVWRSEILNSLHDMGLRGNLPKYIENFLNNREFCVRNGAVHSEYMRLEEGLPQGSVLSVTCFAIAINDIVKQLGTEVHCALYVDDLVIYTTAKNAAHSNRLIQRSINKLTDWTSQKGMRFSEDKTVAIKFEKRRSEEPELTLYNKRIQVQEKSLYLGLVIDKRLNWKPHVEHLRAKCISAVNLIKHISHLSWGADRRTLLHLYTALIQSKLDYGAHIYGMAKPQVLQRLNPIQNECLRACTGAFKSSPIASLCTEAGMLPLEYIRDAITLKNFFKTQAHPESLTHEVFFEDQHNSPHPRQEHIQTLLTHYGIPSPKIWIERIPEKPPWTYPQIKICPFIETKKSNRPEAELRSEFLAHLEMHNSEHAYTDGSKKDQRVGFSAIFQNESQSGSLVGQASIFTAELYAVKTAINKILADDGGTKKFTIFSDSQSALLSLKPGAALSPIAEDIKTAINQASRKSIEIDFCWVPGHMNISGNEKADAAAKEAAARITTLTPTRAIPHTDMKRTIKCAIIKGWQEKWLSFNQEGSKLREIKRDVGAWISSYNKNRRQETALCRLRIGHTNITHAFLMERNRNPPVCERCRVPITVKHLLVQCRKYDATRNKYFDNASLADMLAETSDYSPSRLFKFLQETELLSKL